MGNKVIYIGRTLSIKASQLLLLLAVGVIFSCMDGYELTTKYFTITFTGDADSCRYFANNVSLLGELKKSDFPFELKFKTTSDDPGDMLVINDSDSGDVYVNLQKAEENFDYKIDKDYKIEPGQQLLIGLNQ